MADYVLVHHGILGMKWGVRRYRNYDGTLTKAGEDRYNYDKKKAVIKNPTKELTKESDEALKDPKRWVREDVASAAKAAADASDLMSDFSQLLKSPNKRKDIDLSNMSNRELQARIDRDRLEKIYKESFSEYVNPRLVEGKKVAEKIMTHGAQALAVAGTAATLALTILQIKDRRS